MDKSFKIFIVVIIISTATAGWLMKKKRKALNDVSDCRLNIILSDKKEYDNNNNNFNKNYGIDKISECFNV